jgi:hypothetical protein
MKDEAIPMVLACGFMPPFIHDDVAQIQDTFGASGGFFVLLDAQRRKGKLPPRVSATLIGQTLTVTLPDADAVARGRWFKELDGRADNVSVQNAISNLQDKKISKARAICRGRRTPSDGRNGVPRQRRCACLFHPASSCLRPLS